MAVPPEVVGPDVAVAPLTALDNAPGAGEPGEPVPVVAGAGDRAPVAPVVIPLAVGGEVDVAHLGLAGVAALVPGEPFPWVGRPVVVPVHLGQDRLGAVAEALQHLPHPAFVVEAHDH